MSVYHIFRFFRDLANIPGIKKVGFLDLDSVKDSIIAAAVQNASIVISEPQWLDDVVRGKLSVSAYIKDNSLSRESKLSFSTTSQPPIFPVALVAVDANGNCWMLRGGAPHFGSYDVRISSSAPDGDSVTSECEYVVPAFPVLVSIER